MPRGRALPAGGVLVTGGGGVLGRAVASLLSAQAVPQNHALLDVSGRDAVAAALDRVRPSAVLNCAAANVVDRCETDHAYADVEEDMPNPLSYYGLSELLGEQAVLEAAPHLPWVLVVRTS